MDSQEQPKVQVTIKYRKPGTQPPIFVAGSFSTPTWEPTEMKYTTDPDGEHTFTKTFEAQKGTEIQYKFRVGTGEWWVLDEQAPAVTDDLGNRNNLLNVKSDMETPTLAGVPADAVADQDGKLNDMPPGIERAVGKVALPKAIMELKEEELNRSGRQTPEMARVAAEVADTAAMLDPVEPEEEIPDKLAGELGIRRLTSTPINEVAKTAAEVADTAAKLDMLAYKLPPAEDEAEFTRERPPLFAYECAGLDDDVPSVVVDTGHEEETGDAQEHSERKADGEVDLNDPTIERFPSDKASILKTVQKLETSLEEDQTRFSGVPPSPVVGPEGRFSEAALIDDSFLAKPPSPSLTRKSPDRAPASPRGLSSVNSVLQLDAIAEENAADEPRWPPARELVSEKSSETVEDEDGFLVLTATKATKHQPPMTETVHTNEGGVEPQPRVEASPPQEPEHANNGAADQKKLGDGVKDKEGGVMARHVEEVADSQEAAKTTEIPSVVVLKPSVEPAPALAAVVDPTGGNESVTQAASETGSDILRSPVPVIPLLEPAVSSATASSIEPVAASANNNKLTQRQAPSRATDEDGSPNETAGETTVASPSAAVASNTTATAVKPGQRNWFAAFFRAVWTDWIGGILGGWRRGSAMLLLVVLIAWASANWATLAASLGRGSSSPGLRN